MIAERLPRADELWYYIREREAVRRRREAGQPPPWTNDPILQEFKFTNVSRFHDRTSRELIEHLYSKTTPETDRRSMILSAGVYRYFGTSEFARAVGWLDYDTFDPEYVIDVATRRRSAGERVFTGAYVIGQGGVRGLKERVVVTGYIVPLYAAAGGLVAQAERGWRAMSDALMSVPGYGGSGFMGKELMLDLMYMNFWNTPGIDGTPIRTLPEDYWAWTPIGPGARAGLSYLRGSNDPSTRGDRRDLEDILLLCEEQHRVGIPEYLGYSLSPHDVQFNLCDGAHKYCRTRNGWGRPRSKFRPTV